MQWSEFVVSEWFWAAGAVAVALAALIGSLATFIGSAISRRLNRPEPEWDITFYNPRAGTNEIWDGVAGNAVSGEIVNIGDGTVFQVRLRGPAGEFVDLSAGKNSSKTIPVVRTGDSFRFNIVTNLDEWEGADSVLSWVSPPTRRKKGGRLRVRPYEEHPRPTPHYRNEAGDVIIKEEWEAQGSPIVS